MEFYIKVEFWLNAIAVTITILILILRKEFPVKVEYGVGYYSAKLITRVAFMLWAAYLLWGGEL